MSGGHFNYKQHHITDIVDEVERIVSHNAHNADDEEPYSDAVIQKFREGLKALRIAAVYAQRIDWLVSGDDGEARFLERLEEDLEALK